MKKFSEETIAKIIEVVRENYHETMTKVKHEGEYVPNKPFKGITVRQLESALREKYGLAVNHIEINNAISTVSSITALAQEGFFARMDHGRSPCWYERLTEEQKKNVSVVPYRSVIRLRRYSNASVMNEITNERLPAKQANLSDDRSRFIENHHDQVMDQTFYSRLTSARKFVQAENISSMVVSQTHVENVRDTRQREEISMLEKSNETLNRALESSIKMQNMVMGMFSGNPPPDLTSLAKLLPVPKTVKKIKSA